MTDLYVSAHPDDETLGCGGTILKRRAAGARAWWLIATSAHEPAWNADTIARKAGEVDRVAAAYGMSEVVRLGLPTTRLDVTPRADVMAAIREVVDRVRPETVYLPHPGDVHSDHAAVFDAAVAVMRAFRTAADGPRRILCYETLSSTEAAAPFPARAFLPQVFTDVTKTLAAKLDVMRLYESEAQEEPLPRGASAITALARLRGATVGVEYAEAFALVRELD